MRGLKALDYFENNLKVYNDRYLDYCNEIDLFFGVDKLEFINKYFSDFLEKDANSDWNNFDYNDLVARKIIEVIKMNYYASRVNLMDCNLKLNYYFILINTLGSGMRLNRGNDYDILIDFLFTLTHEIGHQVSQSDTCSGFNSNVRYTFLNELFNDYLSSKIMSRVIDYLPDVIKKNFNHNGSLYELDSFLIDPLVLEYEDVFKIASLKGDVLPLIELMGEDNFNLYICIINDFFEKQKQVSHYSNDGIFELEKDYVDDVKSKIAGIVDGIKSVKRR